MKEIDFVCAFLKKNHKASFKEIWEAVRKEFNIEADMAEKKMGNLYTAMIMDARYFYKNDRNWYLKSEISLDEIKMQNMSLLQEEENDEFDLPESDLTSEIDDDENINIIEDSYDDGDHVDVNKEIRTNIILKEIES